MKARLYSKKVIFKNSYKTVCAILLILFLTITFLFNFNKKVTPKLLNVAEASIDKLNEDILMNYKVSDVYKKVDLNNIINIEKNSKEEIIDIDFNLENVYEVLSLMLNYLQEKLNNVDVRKQILRYYSDDLSSSLDDIVLNIPMGVASDGIYLVNLGPKIPVKVSYVGYFSGKIRLEVKSYGINNSLISIYIDSNISNEFILPSLEEKINHTYSILLISKVIQGIVPKYYGGYINEKSEVLNVPIS